MSVAIAVAVVLFGQAFLPERAIPTERFLDWMSLVLGAIVVGGLVWVHPCP